MMNLSPKYIAAFTLGFFFIIGWNAFLITRDNKMFNEYGAMQRLQHPPSLEIK